MARIRAAVILGAGWSIPAGLPAAADLFTGGMQVTSKASYRRLWLVQSAYRRWAERQSDPRAEIFLLECYKRSYHPAPPWQHVVEYVQVRLSTPSIGDSRSFTSPRYGQRITHKTYYRRHEQFWLDLLARADVSGVITTNYDFLIERSLRHRPMKRPPLPGCHYAGLPAVAAIGQAEPWTVHDRRDRVLLTGHIPLAKLHGSLNWTVTSGSSVVVYQDARAAFRYGGTAAIVPPIPEKEPPAWLAPIWAAAEEILSQADIWVVVGYSLPSYDQAIRNLFRRAGQHLSTVELHDSYAAQLADRWKQLLPQVHVQLFSGIA